MLEQVLGFVVFLGAGLGLLIVLSGVLILLGLGIPLVSLWWQASRT
ncbi:MAG: hypothetical protein SVX38_09580 [Chloroflexota bacterium]|nr:hypothetical protein [Chloroflexota bacterium]